MGARDISDVPVRTAGASTSTPPVRLLLVEDDAGDAELIRTYLAACHFPRFDIEHRVRLRDAIVRLEANSADVVLLDLGLPDSKGVESLRRMLGVAPDVPVVVLTGLDDDKLAVSALREGAQDFLVKGASYQSSTMAKSLVYAIERMRLRDEIRRLIEKNAETEIADLRRTQELERRLWHSDRLASIGQLAAGVAHEINNPASFVDTNLALLGDEVSALREQGSTKTRERSIGRKLGRALDRMSEMLDDCRAGIRRISGIARDLSAFSRAEKDEIEMVDLNVVIDVACKMANHEVRHRATLVKSLGELPAVAADRAKLGQLFLNLLVNAAHAIPEGAAQDNTIEVTSRSEASEVVVTIRDTGVGIPPDILDQIFEPFFTTKGREQGTGLGLSISEDSVQKHGGHIEVESEVGHGTTFRVRIPHDTGLVPAARAVPLTSTTAAPRSAARGRVLVIDDESMLRRALRRALGRAHEVIEAEDGEVALAILAHDRDFDVIFCDLMMPTIDGPGFHDALADTAPELMERVVFTTGGPSTERAAEFLERVDPMVLFKPVPVEAIRQLVAARATQHGRLLQREREGKKT